MYIYIPFGGRMLESTTIPAPGVNTIEFPAVPGRKRGRPISFHEPKQHEFCSLLRLGCTISKAAATVGITRRTVLYAARRDPKLAERIRLARQESRLDPMNKIASSKSWRAAAWLLERRSRDFRLPAKRSPARR